MRDRRSARVKGRMDEYDLAFLFLFFKLITLKVGYLKIQEVKMRYRDRIEVNPDVLLGKPIIKGTRISVEFILELLVNGWDMEQILKNYPQLEKEDILAAIEYSLEILKGEKVFSI